MPLYQYMELPNEGADVFIAVPTGEETEGEYEYETNEFRTKKLTEGQIAADPIKYLDYEETEETMETRVRELEEKNEMLIECIIELADIIYA